MAAEEKLTTGKYDLLREEKDGDIKTQPVYLYAPTQQDYSKTAGDWVIAWQEGVMLLAQDKRINLTDMRVVFVLLAKLDFQNWIRLSHKEIADILGIKRQNVSTSMKKLVEMQVVFIGPSLKQVTTYKINPLYIWKGDIRQGTKERRHELKVLQGGKSEEVETTQ